MHENAYKLDTMGELVTIIKQWAPNYGAAQSRIKALRDRRL